MHNSTKVKECLKPVVGWKDHYDLNEIPALSDGLKVSESGEYYQEKHPALRLDLIKATLPENRDLEEYLNEMEESAIVECLNDVSNLKQMNKVGKEIVSNDIIYNQGGWVNKTILNESRFVGIRFRPQMYIGLKAQINKLALQFTHAQAQDPDGLKIYLYHSHKESALLEINFKTDTGNQFNWIEANVEMFAVDSDLAGGEFFLGYYQDDIVGNAVSYEKLNWRFGYCTTCDGGASSAKYNKIAKYVNMQGFYLPADSIHSERKMFDPEAIIENNNTNYGFNFNITVKCDLTEFWCTNRLTLKELISLKVVHKILKTISFSQQINHVEEQLKMMIIRDLEGDKETNYINIPQQYEKALKTARFNYSSLNKVCLPCSVNSGVTYGVV